MHFIVHTDGGARGNPGPAGIGVVITNEKGGVVKKFGVAIGEATNNVAEYEAVIYALTELKKIVSEAKRAGAELEFVLDSELVVKQLKGEYQVKEEPLQLQFMKIWNMRVAHFPHMTFRHVPREENAEADRLMNEALDGVRNNLF